MKWEELKPMFNPTPEWSDTVVECPECGEYIKRNQTMVYTTYPPQFQYKCFKCGWVGCK